MGTRLAEHLGGCCKRILRFPLRCWDGKCASCPCDVCFHRGWVVTGTESASNGHPPEGGGSGEAGNGNRKRTGSFLTEVALLWATTQMQGKVRPLKRCVT